MSVIVIKWKSNLLTSFRNTWLRLRYYRLKPQTGVLQHAVIMFIDDKYFMWHHPGLVDRFKAIVGLYYLATMNKRVFKLQFSEPFMLEKYLLPNEVDWSLSGKEIDYGIKSTRLIEYSFLGCEKLHFDDNVNQYHCYLYTGHNYLQWKQISDWERQWRAIFNKLFCPSKYLNELLEHALPINPYIAVHIRFINALGRFEKGFNKVLSQKEQLQLINKCFKKIDEIKQSENYSLYIVSDNGYFIQLAEQRGYLNFGAKNIGHISFDSDVMSHDKAFIDFFALTRAAKVYAIHGYELYDSVFPYYAAIIGGISFKVENI